MSAFSSISSSSAVPNPWPALDVVRRRIGRPEEIAEAALYFASEEAAYVTGQVLNMSGGAVIANG